jgi:hypothetical protein
MTEIVAEGLAKGLESQLITMVNTMQEPLFNPTVLVSELRKKLEGKKAVSNQGRYKGRVPHPIDMEATAALMGAVHIHEVCLSTKRDAVVGLGFETVEEDQARARKRELEAVAHATAVSGDPKAKPPGAPGDKPPAPVKKEFPVKPTSGAQDPAQAPDPGAPKPKSKVEEVLDEFCEEGFQALLDKLGEDFETHGNAYMEVIRDDGGAIVGLDHMPAGRVFVYNEDKKPFKHFEVEDIHEGTGRTLKFARWDEAERISALVGAAQPQVTELVPFRKTTSRNPDYGLPDYLSCVPWLELAQFIMQYDFDYFQNRAVPDLLVLLTGKTVPPSEIKVFVDSLKQTIGAKNRHRSIVANFSPPDLNVVVERLNADNRERFGDLWSAVQLAIVSSHRVPPLLAGVSLPGKMAAANELPNALIAFQTLYVDRQQGVFERAFGRTLGSEEAGLGLTPNDFKLRKITDAYDMGQVDTMSRMRETTTEAQLAGRDLKDGLEK